MNTHPYLRAYMAGIAVPTAFLLVILTGFFIARHVYAIPIPIERVIVFPMALLPNLFGLWNMLYVRLSARRRVSIGIHGALLPFMVIPIAFAIATSLGFLTFAPGGLLWLGTILVPYAFLAVPFAIAPALYYLLWKYLVGFLNGVLGIA